MPERPNALTQLPRWRHRPTLGPTISYPIERRWVGELECFEKTLNDTAMEGDGVLE